MNHAGVGEASAAYTLFSYNIANYSSSKQNQPQAMVYENDSMRSMRGEILFSNEKISITSVYPNPASAYASIDYQLINDTNNAKIILCNVLGNVVGEYALIRDAKTLHISTLELNSGIYFYTLSVDGKSLVTRKLIIKHHS
jgi:hypothetical protein